MGKVAARNRTVGETGDAAMFQARQLWPSESGGSPLFFRRFNGRLWSMVLFKIDYNNELDQGHCSFIVGKARVTPVKHKTIPRLELAAATTSARMSEFVRNELEYPEMKEFFWTDS